MRDGRPEPFFLETPGGRIFLMLRAARDAKHCVLFVPPFAEEMNKCRRQLTETAGMLAAAGSAALVLDLFGTGDSAGEFCEATWDVWQDNIMSALSWAAREGLPVEGLLATRLGCILAAEAVGKADGNVSRTAFWQPVESGRQFMTQFLRLRVAASMMARAGAETVDDLRARLERGESVEIAGYALSPVLWRSVEKTGLAPMLDAHLGRLSIFEVGTAREGELSMTGRRMLQTATDSGLEASGVRIPGSPFWSSTEIVTNTELARKTVEFLTEVA